MITYLKIIITVFLFKIGSTDWKRKKIYNKDLERLLFSVLVYLWSYGGQQVVDKIIGTLIISIPMLMITCFWTGSFGGGDIKLITICGLLLGSKGILYAAWIALLAASFYAVCIMTLEKSRKAEVALGPFICFGVLCVYLNIF